MGFLFHYDDSRTNSISRENADLIQRLRAINLTQCEGTREALLSAAEQWDHRKADWSVLVVAAQKSGNVSSLVINGYQRFVAESVNASKAARASASLLRCHAENDSTKP